MARATSFASRASAASQPETGIGWSETLSRNAILRAILRSLNPAPSQGDSVSLSAAAGEPSDFAFYRGKHEMGLRRDEVRLRHENDMDAFESR